MVASKKLNSDKSNSKLNRLFYFFDFLIKKQLPSERKMLILFPAGLILFCILAYLSLVFYKPLDKIKLGWLPLPLSAIIFTWVISFGWYVIKYTIRWQYRTGHDFLYIRPTRGLKIFKKLFLKCF